MVTTPPRRCLAAGCAAAAFGLALAATAAAQPILAVTTAASPAGQQHLIGFDSQSPGVIASDQVVTGLQSGENVEAIDFFRDFQSQTLYAVGSTSRLYTLNTSS